MIDIKTQYQASAFINAADIEATPDNIRRLMDAFHEEGFIPGTIHELGTQGIKPVPRLTLSSPVDGGWSIHFPSNRVAIMRNPTDPRGENLGTIEEFTSEVTSYLRKILEVFKKKANRLSLVSSFLLQDMSPDAREKVFRRVSTSPPLFYAASPPFEWNWRAVARTPMTLEGTEEQANVITEIKRMQGKLIVPESTLRVCANFVVFILPCERIV